MSVLRIENLSKAFGGLQVINQFSLEIGVGVRHAIIGPNGAGKTTLFNMITGWERPDSGRILVRDQDIAGMTPENVTKTGVARSFQKNALFNTLTVFENLMIAARTRENSVFSLFGSFSSAGPARDKVESVASLLGLSDQLRSPVSSLSYGHKRQLEVALSLCSDPQVLLLDEPVAGTSASERNRLVDLIKNLPSEMTIVLVEHDMDVVFETCDVISVLNYGETIATGTPEWIRNHAEVQSAYLGHAHA